MGFYSGPGTAHSHMFTLLFPAPPQLTCRQVRGLGTVAVHILTDDKNGGPKKSERDIPRPDSTTRTLRLSDPSVPRVVSHLWCSGASFSVPQGPSVPVPGSSLQCLGHHPLQSSDASVIQCTGSSSSLRCLGLSSGTLSSSTVLGSLGIGFLSSHRYLSHHPLAPPLSLAFALGDY